MAMDESWAHVTPHGVDEADGEGLVGTESNSLKEEWSVASHYTVATLCWRPSCVCVCVCV